MRTAGQGQCRDAGYYPVYPLLLARCLRRAQWFQRSPQMCTDFTLPFTGLHLGPVAARLALQQIFGCEPVFVASPGANTSTEAVHFTSIAQRSIPQIHIFG